MLLLDAVIDRIGDHAVRTGAGIESFDQNADGVQVRTGAGAFTGAALIGADGIDSTVRAALHRGADPLMWSGITMYRGGHPDAGVPGRPHHGDRAG